jgi:hypothetical protein
VKWGRAFVGNAQLEGDYFEGSIMKLAWRFRCFSQRTSEDVVSQVWHWRVEAVDGTVSVPSKGFSTLPECVADAKRRGFMGDVDPSTGTFTASHYDMNVGDYGDFVFRPRIQP